MSSAIERLVDGEVAEPARRHDADAQAFRVALDRRADGLAQPVAAPRRGLVGRVIGIEHDRHDRDRHAVHEAAVDEGEGMPLAFSLGQGIGGGDVEVAVDQRGDQMVGKLRLDRIVPRLALLVVAGRGALHPVRRRLIRWVRACACGWARWESSRRDRPGCSACCRRDRAPCGRRRPRPAHRATRRSGRRAGDRAPPSRRRGACGASRGQARPAAKAGLPPPAHRRSPAVHPCAAARAAGRSPRTAATPRRRN